MSMLRELEPQLVDLWLTFDRTLKEEGRISLLSHVSSSFDEAHLFEALNGGLDRLHDARVKIADDLQ